MVLALTLLAVFLASLLGGTLGFGSQLLLAPALAVIDPSLVPGPLLGVGMVLVVLIMLRDGHGATWGEVRPLVGGHIIGALAAGVLLVQLPARSLEVVFSLSVLLAIAVSRRRGPHWRADRGVVLWTGAAAGLLTTVASMGGPIVALHYDNESAVRFRALLAKYFVMSSVFSLAVMAASDKFGWTELGRVALLTPAVVAGFSLSGRGAARLDGQTLRNLVLALSAVASTFVLVRALVR